MNSHDLPLRAGKKSKPRSTCSVIAMIPNSRSKRRLRVIGGRKSPFTSYISLYREEEISCLIKEIIGTRLFLHSRWDFEILERGVFRIFDSLTKTRGSLFHTCSRHTGHPYVLEASRGMGPITVKRSVQKIPRGVRTGCISVDYSFLCRCSFIWLCRKYNIGRSLKLTPRSGTRNVSGIIKYRE